MADWLKGSEGMAARIRVHDWASTPLGPLESWPDVLKTTVALCLSSHFPQAIVWGRDLITLHNDAFIPILGNKPAALGRPFNEVWQEAWSEIRHIADAAFAGEATYIEDFPLSVERGGAPEQAYFTFCYSPIRDQHGQVVGFIDTVTETTATVVANLRLGFFAALDHAVEGATHPDVIMATTTRLVCEQLHLSNCAYADMDPDEDGFTIRGDWAAPGTQSIQGRYRLIDFGRLAVSRLRAGEPLVINDNLRELAPHEAATFQAIGIAATVCIPLVKDGRLIALMAIHDKVPRAWSAYELTLIRDVTERSWAHIERVRAEAALRDAVEALARLNATLEQRVEERSARLAQAQAELRQAQKLEAIGQLTGGVAHDFNNLLTIIRSSLHFLRRADLTEERRSRYLDTISDTVDHGAKLTGQLLAFARRQALKPEVFDVGQRLQAIRDMLEAAVGTQVNVALELPAQPCFTHADLGQFETALINMAVNARDAMGGQGRLTLALRHESLDQGGLSGSFAAIAVSDTGVGIAPEVVARIFEPFFTTKSIGQGTGLGLSQVFGFARQSGGDVQVSSAPGQGATFTLLLPAVEAVPVSAKPPRPEWLPGDCAGQRILLVEDNQAVGSSALQMLQDLGYRASWVSTAEEALAQVDADVEGFDAVFSDVLMPGMNGIDLANELRRRYPQLPVVLTSGYSQVLSSTGHEGFELLRKPYSVEQVASVLRTVLLQAAPKVERALE